MTSITPTKLIKFVADYDYEISLKQAHEILSLLDDQLGIFTSSDIQIATDYVVMGDKSRFKDYFE